MVKASPFGEVDNSVKLYVGFIPNCGMVSTIATEDHVLRIDIYLVGPVEIQTVADGFPRLHT